MGQAGVERAIKRMKSLGNLDNLPAKSETLATAWLHANLIGTLLTETLAAEILDPPPLNPAATPRAVSTWRLTDAILRRCAPKSSAPSHSQPCCARPGL